jgi:hypothetical protein
MGQGGSDVSLWSVLVLVLVVVLILFLLARL